MKAWGRPYRSIWVKSTDARTVQIIDQRFLPHQCVLEDLTQSTQIVNAIKEMHVRGAPLIGVTAAYGIYFALIEAAQEKNARDYFEKRVTEILASRPTAVNLEWAVAKQLRAVQAAASWDEKIQNAFENANQMAEEDVRACRKIGEAGLGLIEEISRKKKGGPVQILTHCNAGWLACVDWGTATAPLYKAHEQGIPLHVWVNETRPRSQGASLTAWELLEEGIPHTVIVDSAGGYLMKRGKVDLVLVGADRVAPGGDVANKIGTYMVALAARDNSIPFYVAAPASSVDWTLQDAFGEIPIEERDADEVKYVSGLAEGGVKKVLVSPEKSPAKNFAFDITPAELVSGLITERGIARADRKSLLELFPDRNHPTSEEGVIKFDCEWTRSEPLAEDVIEDLNRWRNRLFDGGLIGAYPDGVGYGNISIRAGKQNQFIVSGSKTGGRVRTNGRHYTLVSAFDIKHNRVICRGPVAASSESLTHGMLYEISPQIHAVIHVHHRRLWECLLGQVPQTGPEIPYGTVEMALAVRKLFETAGLQEKKIFVMAGHEEGIVTFGSSLEEAAAILSACLQKCRLPGLGI